MLTWILTATLITTDITGYSKTYIYKTDSPKKEICIKEAQDAWFNVINDEDLDHYQFTTICEGEEKKRIMRYKVLCSPYKNSQRCITQTA